ncbi:hypothetical protein BDZ94DRAFT_1244194 [Collybia nuda]|uniref:Ricin B lectin domain-containing protein n=1 Tax=Collybia nuda TaxID=64659 RepID=A0A9P5YHX5_9AGAR|nr:hypothetical protein BDZ94DRAFT_1244194 [Collybia nuda]
MLSFPIILLSLSLCAMGAPLPVQRFQSRQTVEPFVLPVPAEGPGPLFDSTAVRAATGSQIWNSASPDICFDVSDFRAGDFRFNLVPLALKKCDSSVDGQKFDLITKGAHNNVQDGSRTLIVSSQQFTCVDRRGNKNDRNRPGLFACGGRAVGDGETTADQQFFFDSNASLSGGIGFPIVQNSVNNGVGPGNLCLTLNADGFVSNTPCSPPLFTPEQTWYAGNGSGAPVPTSPIPAPSPASVPAPPISVPAPAPTSPSATGPEPFTLPVPAEGPGPVFDATAVRVATGSQIRNAASPDTCFDVSDFRSGDFRFNLVPLALKKCDSSIDGQKFDLITKGEHNNVQDGSRTLIVSSQQFTCIDRRGNKNDRNRPGLFACGGRAAGDGETTSDQQFFFDSKASLSGGIGFPIVQNSVNNGFGPGNQCLTLNADGFVSNSPCAPPFFTLEQTWFVGNSAEPAPLVEAPSPATVTVTVTADCSAPTTR